MDEHDVVDLDSPGVDVDHLAELVDGRLVDERPTPTRVLIREVVDDSRSPLLRDGGDALFLARYSRTEAERDPSKLADIAREAAAAGAVAIAADHLVPGLAEQVPVLVCRSVDEVAGILASEVHGRPSDHLQVVLVTGTDGKTTTTTMTAAAIAAPDRRVGRFTTVERLIGGMTDPARLTTSEAVDLQRDLANARRAGDRAVVVESSSIAAAQGRLNGVGADVVIFTNLSSEHQDQHDTMLRYFAAKVDLFDPTDGRIAVVNVDDPWGEVLVHLLTLVRATIVLVSPSGREVGPAGRPVDVRCTDQDLHPEAGSDIKVIVRGSTVRFHVPMEGSHNVANALCALGAAVALGIDVSTAAEGISQVDGVAGRLEVVPNDRGVLAYVDYAHTPQALGTVLTTLRERAKQRGGRIIVVAGCGGERDPSKRPAMGSACAEGADVFIATDDNPRTEHSDRILDEMVGQLAEVRRIPNRREAIAAAVDEARPGDIIIVAGKGHERDQIVGLRRTPFSDQEVLAELLGRTWSTEEQRCSDEMTT